MAILIDGKSAAAKLRSELAFDVSQLDPKSRKPGLAVILVGDDPASQVYVRNKVRQAQDVGIRSIERRLPYTTTQVELIAEIVKLNRDPTVDAILVQLPLPRQIDANAIISTIDPEKDVDGFHPTNVGRLAVGLDAPVPCTPQGCLRLIKDFGGDLVGKSAVVLGRSNIVGKPMASLLTGQDCTVTLAHSRTRDLPDVCRRADILVAAVGRPGLIRGDWIKPGAVVIDVGINRLPSGALTGDVEFDEAAKVAGAITPVPGGVGPMTIACLLSNTLKCFRARPI